MELKKQKNDSSENYSWTDYMSLPFTQNVSYIMYYLRVHNFILHNSALFIFIFAKTKFEDAHFGSEGDKRDS